jgi:hypothetical protein
MAKIIGKAANDLDSVRQRHRFKFELACLVAQVRKDRRAMLSEVLPRTINDP